MAKNLKINVKNTQLAAALNLGKIKKAPEKKKVEEPQPEIKVEKTPPIQPEPKKVAPQPEVKAAPVEPEKKPQVDPKKEDQPPIPFQKKEEPTPAPSQERPPFRQPYSSSHGSSQQRYSPPQQDRYAGGSYRSQQRPAGPERTGGEQSQYNRPYSSRPPMHQRPYQPRPQQGGYSSGSRPPFTPGQRPPYNPGQGGQRPPYTPGQGGQRPPYTPGQGARPHAGPRTPYAPRRDSGPFRPGLGGGGYRPTDTRRPPLPPKEPPRFEEKKKTFEPKAPQKEFKEHKPAKKMEERSFDSRDRKGLRADIEEQGWRKRRPSHKLRSQQTQEETIRPKELAIRVPVTVKDLASAMKLKASQLIAKLFMKGVILTLNDFLEDETTIQLLGQDFDCDITIDRTEENRVRITDKTISQEIRETPEESLLLRPPVVAFMGHVDHGKTSLIDAIRKSDVASGEAGAITQHIGAFKCHTAVGDLTILDTPGHEAFSAMRTRGATVTDIVVLVIAGDEGIRAQTLEAITQAQEAKVPIVVALNKSDKPNFNPENVYRQLAENQLLPEAWGGQTITVNCSAVSGEGVKELLEMLALQAEILELRANPNIRARGTVIESQMHKGHGAVATILVQNGTLHLGNALVFTKQFAKVKTMSDEHGKMLVDAGPSTPVKITGLSDLPEAGSEFIVVKNEKEAMEIAEMRSQGERMVQLAQGKKGAELFLAEQAGAVKKKHLNLILRADVQGSLEALKTSLLKIVTNKVELNIVSSSVGEISESDIQLASASKATIIGFHTRVESHAESLIKALKVTIRLHDIIYHAVDDVRALMKATLDKLAQETDAGAAEVKATFKASQLGIIAGCVVTDGSIKRSSHLRQIRDGQTIWKGAIHSLKKVKEDVREVSKGQECGIVLQNNNDVKVGDILQAFEITYLEQEL